MQTAKLVSARKTKSRQGLTKKSCVVGLINLIMSLHQAETLRLSE